jgi:hypothetical protein
MKTSIQSERLLDDGHYYIVLNQHQAADRAAGFLQRRCTVSPTTPGGFECIGSYAIRADGRWEAHIARRCGAVDDNCSTLIVAGVDRLDAIVGLWQARRPAPPRRREKVRDGINKKERLPVTVPAPQALREEPRRRPRKNGATPAKEGSIAAAIAWSGFAAAANAVEIWPIWLLAL